MSDRDEAWSLFTDLGLSGSDGMKRQEAEDLLDRVRYRDWHFFVSQRKGVGVYFQVRFWALNLDGKTSSLRYGRKWRIGPWMTKGDVVKMALSAVLAIEDQLARERFTFLGAAVYSPYHDTYTLVEVCRDPA
jgi:hypothetical protein